MTYRDETFPLREKILALATEQAKLEGELAGMNFRLAEAKDEAKEIARKNVLARAGHAAKRGTARLVGGIFVLVAVCTACLTLSLFFHSVTSYSTIIPVEYAVRAGTEVPRCSIRIDDEFLQDYEASVSCNGEEVYRSTGNCRSGMHGLEFWDHQDPSFVMATQRGRAVLRQAGVPTEFSFAPRD